MQNPVELSSQSLAKSLYFLNTKPFLEGGQCQETPSAFEAAEGGVGIVLEDAAEMMQRAKSLTFLLTAAAGCVRGFHLHGVVLGTSARSSAEGTGWVQGPQPLAARAKPHLTWIQSDPGGTLGTLCRLLWGPQNFVVCVANPAPSCSAPGLVDARCPGSMVPMGSRDALVVLSSPQLQLNGRNRAQPAKPLLRSHHICSDLLAERRRKKKKKKG